MVYFFFSFYHVIEECTVCWKKIIFTTSSILFHCKITTQIFHCCRLNPVRNMHSFEWTKGAETCLLRFWLHSDIIIFFTKLVDFSFAKENKVCLIFRGTGNLPALQEKVQQKFIFMHAHKHLFNLAYLLITIIIVIIRRMYL